MSTDFRKFADLVQSQYNKMAKTGQLFVIENKSAVWDTYLASFPPGTNPVFRERGEYDCNCCKQFIRNLASLVSITEQGQLITVFDLCDKAPWPFNEVAATCREFVVNQRIESVFATREKTYGRLFNHAMIDGVSVRFEHFQGHVPDRFVVGSVGERIGQYQQTHHLLRRGLEELTLSALDAFIETVSEDQTAIYRGHEHLGSAKAFRKLKAKYDSLTSEREKEIFCWNNVSNSAARFKNTVIGTLISDLSEGKDFEEAVKAFEHKVAPHNYKRPKPLITTSMVNKSLETIDQLGLRNSLERRHAQLSEMSVKHVLYVDRNARPMMKDGLQDMLMSQVKPRKPSNSETAREISLTDFIKDVLPQTEQLEILFESRLTPNLMSVTAPVHDNPTKLFTWGNDFAWSYYGNTADSDIKARVKNAGGNVSAPFRVSLAWRNIDDLDLHCRVRNQHIYFGNRQSILDVDMNAMSTVTDPVENMCWKDPKDGVYLFSVNNYRCRVSHDKGYELEVEYLGDIQRFDSTESPGQSQTQDCLRIEIKNGKMNLDIVGNVRKTMSTNGEVWDLSQNQYHRVTSVMRSPNHWNDDSKGLEHIFFIVEGCKNDEPVRGMYNEYLRSDLQQHRRVFELLGSKMSAPVSDDQLSGLGFNTTTKNHFVAKVTGDNPGIYKVTI